MKPRRAHLAIFLALALASGVACNSLPGNPGDGGDGGGGGGTGWQRQNSPTVNDLLSVSFPDSLHGWAVGVFSILHTSDGGRTWVAQTQNAVHQSVQFNAASATDSLHCWIAGADGKIQATSDAGRTWRLEPTPISDAVLNSIFFSDNLHGWAAGRLGGAGLIFYTVNGGDTWTTALTTGLHELYSVSFGRHSDFFHGVAVGTLGDIAVTQDGGQSWTHVSSPTTLRLQAVALAPVPGSVTGVAGGIVGVGGALRSEDGGQSWTVGQPLPGGMEVRGALLIDSSNAWIVGQANGRAEVAHSSDAGISWIGQAVSWNLPLNSISMVDASHGWLVGDNGAIFVTRTGGF